MSESRSRSTSPAVEQENKSEEGAARDARSSRSPSPAAMDRSRSPSIKRQSRSRSRSRSGSRSRSASSASSSSESEDVTEFFDRRRAVRRLKRGERELMQLKQRLVEKECLIVLEVCLSLSLSLACHFRCCSSAEARRSRPGAGGHQEAREAAATAIATTNTGRRAEPLSCAPAHATARRATTITSAPRTPSNTATRGASTLPTA